MTDDVRVKVSPGTPFMHFHLYCMIYQETFQPLLGFFQSGYTTHVKPEPNPMLNTDDAKLLQCDNVIADMKILCIHLQYKLFLLYLML